LRDLCRRIQDNALTELTVTTSHLGRNAPLFGATIGALELARQQRTTTHASARNRA
jgi:hypothetical protein